MKKISYELNCQSSLVLSPRAGQAFYLDKDSPKAVSSGERIRVVYPFYQYGEYEEYDPENAEYYIPGSSIKGALEPGVHGGKLMVDDVKVPGTCVILQNLWKAQYLQETAQAAFDWFFPNVGVEMVKAGTVLSGELYLADGLSFQQEILERANQSPKKKMGQMCKYLETLLCMNYKDENLNQSLKTMQKGLMAQSEKNNVILLGGYKGLLHSILLKGEQCGEDCTNGSLFLDRETGLPHGLVELSVRGEPQIS